MDKCPTELVSLIVKDACASDLGKTARIVGLVSKRLRAFTEPLEFRALVIAGPEQLKATLARLDKVQETQRSVSSYAVSIGVRHIFICDLKSAHALAVDPLYGDAQCGFPGTPEGQKAISYYRDVSATLVTLTTVKYMRRLTKAPIWDNHRALNMLSGLDLPRLESFTLGEDREPGEDHQFVPPVAPSLQRLHFVAPLRGLRIGKEQTRQLHPLLVGMHSRFGALAHLTICVFGMRISVETLMATLSGSVRHVAEPASASTPTVGRQLPGKLISAAVQVRIPVGYGVSQNWLLKQCMQNADRCIDTMRGFCIRGMEVLPPPPPCPVEGNREYEVLLANWEERAFAER
ncbi:hypothetical protein M0805_007882 [Coniferiporia weirii]|nr:hypothetical protein M0805_007882 [Coniferiporia weirii]